MEMGVIYYWHPLAHCFQELLALLHCCLGDPWAGVGLVLILKTAKHLGCNRELQVRRQHRLLGTEMPLATNSSLL
ncbi:hypothetical protein V8C86DRAFT_2763306 [Haematococcus lacustris]